MAITQGKRACSVCGTLLADDSAYCPVCALRGAVETQSDSVTDISSELCFEHYQVLKNEGGTPMELGRGGMGVTFKAIDIHLRCPVALKIISAQFIGNESARSRFLREARAAASVRHPNVAGLERAVTLDPRNPELLDTLAYSYRCVRRYRDYERILDRLIELEPDQPLFPLYKAQSAFEEKADLKTVRAAYEALPTSMKDDVNLTLDRVYYAMCARDFAAAGEIVSKSPNEEIILCGALVPRRIVTLWLELVLRLFQIGKHLSRAFKCGTSAFVSNSQPSRFKSISWHSQVFPAIGFLLAQVQEGGSPFGAQPGGLNLAA